MSGHQKHSMGQANEVARKRQAVPPVSQEPVLLQEQTSPLTLSVQRTIMDPGQAGPTDILALQCTAGNRAISRLIQAKLMVGPAGDKYEQEADRVADHLMSMRLPSLDRRPPEGSRWVGGEVEHQAGGEAVQMQPLAQGQIAIQRVTTGLATTEATGTFVSGAMDVYNNWGTLAPNARLQRLGNLANQRLIALGVPAVVLASANLGGDSGQFDNATWTLEVDSTSLNQPTIDSDEMAEMVDTIYHEARHTEQFFRAARWMAGEGKTAAQIATDLSIPGRIASQAVASPLSPLGPWERLIRWNESGYRAEARTWAESLGPTGTARYTRIMDELDQAEQALATARQTYRDNPGLATWWAFMRAKVVYNQKYAAYRNVAEERDAWAVGGAAGSAFRVRHFFERVRSSFRRLFGGGGS